MPDDIVVEATGETVGEAKWAALRELERRLPGLDKAAVLGVGYEPARVLAQLPADAVVEAPPPGPREGESELAADVRALVERVVHGIGVDGRVTAVETDDAVDVVVSGSELGPLIGRHGQTIDALQYLLNTIVYRSYGDARKEVVLDAAGYRERRRETLEEIAVRSAERALHDLDRVELEPMTAIDRKIVHLRLADYDGVETSSEGAEPNRYVVITPTG
jgi:spoIIIJ-associated protein